MSRLMPLAASIAPIHASARTSPNSEKTSRRWGAMRRAAVAGVRTPLSRASESSGSKEITRPIIPRPACGERVGRSAGWGECLQAIKGPLIRLSARALPKYDAVFVECGGVMRLQVLPDERGALLVRDVIDVRQRGGKDDQRGAGLLSFERGDDFALRALRFVHRHAHVADRRLAVEDRIEQAGVREVEECVVRRNRGEKALRAVQRSDRARIEIQLAEEFRVTDRDAVRATKRCREIEDVIERAGDHDQQHDQRELAMVPEKRNDKRGDGKVEVVMLPLDVRRSGDDDPESDEPRAVQSS